MARGTAVLVRAMAAMVMLATVAQCGGPAVPTAAPTTAAASVGTTAPVGTTSPVDTTAGVDATPDTTAPETTTLATPIETTTTLVEPTTTTLAEPVIDPNCPLTPHAAVIDRDRQRAWLCENGFALPEFKVTTARDQPDPGTYPVFSKSVHASSRFGGHFSTMTHFVAFTRGEETGARIAFHTVPVLRTGEYAQPLASVGTQMEFGASSGCIRVLPEDGPVIWDWLQQGDEVRVIT